MGVLLALIAQPRMLRHVPPPSTCVFEFQVIFLDWFFSQLYVLPLVKEF